MNTKIDIFKVLYTSIKHLKFFILKSTSPKIMSVIPILSIRTKIIPIPALWNWNNNIAFLKSGMGTETMKKSSTGTNNGIGHDYTGLSIK